MVFNFSSFGHSYSQFCQFLRTEVDVVAPEFLTKIPNYLCSSEDVIQVVNEIRKLPMQSQFSLWNLVTKKYPTLIVVPKEYVIAGIQFFIDYGFAESAKNLFMNYFNNSIVLKRVGCIEELIHKFQFHISFELEQLNYIKLIVALLRGDDLTVEMSSILANTELLKKYAYVIAPFLKRKFIRRIKVASLYELFIEWKISTLVEKTSRAEGESNLGDVFDTCLEGIFLFPLHLKFYDYLAYVYVNIAKQKKELFEKIDTNINWSNDICPMIYFPQDDVVVKAKSDDELKIKGLILKCVTQMKIEIFEGEKEIKKQYFDITDVFTDLDKNIYDEALILHNTHPYQIRYRLIEIIESKSTSIEKKIRALYTLAIVLCLENKLDTASHLSISLAKVLPRNTKEQRLFESVAKKIGNLSLFSIAKKVAES